MPSLKKFASTLRLARSTTSIKPVFCNHDNRAYQGPPGGWPSYNDSEQSLASCPAIRQWLQTSAASSLAENWTCSPAIRDLDWSQFTDEEAHAIAMSFDAPRQIPSPADSAVSLYDNPKPFRPYVGKGKGRLVESKSVLNEEQDQLARQFAALLEQEKRDRAIQEEADLQAAKALQAELDREIEEEREAEAFARQRDCNICGDTMDKSLFPVDKPTRNCVHESTTCTNCLQTWLATEFSSKGCETPIRCPECPSQLQYADIQRHVTPAVFESFDKLSARQALSNLPEFSWCLGPGCGSGQLNMDNNNSFMRCYECNYMQCLTHKCKWHDGETCAQYDYRTSGQKSRDEERETEAVLDTVSKKCPGPKCGWRIQKASGCDHMTCRRCRYEFCWVCLASQDKIRREGNTAHETSCQYHSDRLAVTWPFNMH